MGAWLGTVNGPRKVAAVHVGTDAGRRPVERAWVGTSVGNRLWWTRSAPPPAPAGFTATTVSSTRIDLAWTVEPGMGYVLRRGSMEIPAGTGTATDTGLQPGAAYTYRLDIKAGGALLQSVTATAVTMQVVTKTATLTRDRYAVYDGQFDQRDTTELYYGKYSEVFGRQAWLATFQIPADVRGCVAVDDVEVSVWNAYTYAADGTSVELTLVSGPLPDRWSPSSRQCEFRVAPKTGWWGGDEWQSVGYRVCFDKTKVAEAFRTGGATGFGMVSISSETRHYGFARNDVRLRLKYRVEVPATSAWPDASSAGVPAGTVLQPLTAATSPNAADTFPTAEKFIVNTPGAVFDGWLFDRWVEVRAKDVVFRNCWFAGPASIPADVALLRVQAGDRSVVAERCTFRPAVVLRTDAVRGSNIVVDRCDIAGTVDGVHVYGAVGDRADPFAGHVTVRDSWIHDLTFFPDAEGDGTHNDAVQVVGGDQIEITGNRFSNGIRNAGVQVTQALHDVDGCVISGNLFECVSITGVNSDEKGNKAHPVGLTVTGNVFVKGAQQWPIVITGLTLGTAVVSGNTWADGSVPGPVPVLLGEESR